MALDGVYETVMKTAMGDQKITLTVTLDGDGWTGSQVSDKGSTDISKGTIDGNTLKWITKLSKPISMTLKNEATIEGDTLTGLANAGVFGKFVMTGRKVS